MPEPAMIVSLPFAADDQVVAGAAIKRVLAGPGDKRVVGGVVAEVESVVAAAADGPHGRGQARGGGERVVAGAAVENKARHAGKGLRVG